MAGPPGKRIIIIGGGASGVLMACHLLRDHRDEFVVTLIERRAEVGPGVAYSTDNPNHLLNVRAANMSAYADDPEHFWRWASQQPGNRRLCPDPYCFVERGVYGRYVAGLLHAYRGEGADARLHIVQGECRAVSDRPGGIAVTLDNGATHIGQFVIVATGSDSYGFASEGDYDSPWAESSFRNLDPALPILVLGTGLTMVDYVLSLVNAGHLGPIFAMSRRGLLPQVHAQVPAEKISKDDVPFSRPPGAFSGWLRKRIAAHVASGGDWRGVIDGLRPFTQEIWWTFSKSAKRRFLEHARSWWDVHRHRIAPETNDKLKAIMASRQLEVAAARFLGEKQVSGATEFSFRRRGVVAAETLKVQKIIDCRGIVSNPAKSANPLMRSLLDQGLARVDQLAIGLDISLDSAVIDATGTASRRLFAIGPVSRAAFWEVVAVPDIRTQCAKLARHLKFSGT